MLLKSITLTKINLRARIVCADVVPAANAAGGGGAGVCHCQHMNLSDQSTQKVIPDHFNSHRRLPKQNTNRELIFWQSPPCIYKIKPEKRTSTKDT